MQVLDPDLAQSLATPDLLRSLPPRVTPALLDRLAAGASLLGGHHESHTVIAPFTGQPVGSVLMGTAEDVHYAVGRARRAQQAWAERPLDERAAVLKRYHDLVLERQHEGMDIVQMESGKSRLDAYTEVSDVAIVSRYYAYHGPKHLRPERRAGLVPLLTQTEVLHHPKGVVGIIAPWNYPLSMAITDAIPALLAGNAVVVKPAEQTPFTALWAVQLLYEAGLPPEVLHVVTGRGEDAGAALIDAADFLHFTGSTEVGKIVWRHAGEDLKGVSLELGGKNPLIVRHDADLEQTVQGVMQAAFSSAGQLCISAERIYVHESIFDEFVTRFAAAAQAMEINARYDFSAHMGSLVSEEQLDKVTEHVHDAMNKGATVVTGGRQLPEIGPLFYAPTILTGVERGMLAYREETFGPVVALYPFNSDDEAVAEANDSAYGLNASVWTRDTRAGRRIAEQIECGTVSVNDAFYATWGSTDAPMGGFKQSGVGRRHGPEGLLKYTEAQTVAVQHGGPLAPAALGLTAERFANLFTQTLKVVRQLPGLR
jgi:succinate-semialdehyde dehydrogenase/glutarate-semialdehyde dehydrogenase